MNHNFGKFTLTKVNTSTRFPRISRTHFYRACIQRPIVTFHVGPYVLQKRKNNSWSYFVRSWMVGVSSTSRLVSCYKII